MTNPLNIDYSRFNEEDIPNHLVRTGLNRAFDGLAGLIAITTILRANETEVRAQDPDSGSESLSPHLVDGLLRAAIQLSESAAMDIEELGMRIQREAKW